MPRYYFDIYNDEIVHDPEGIELADLGEARKCAVKSVSELLAEQVASGTMIDPRHRIEIRLSEHDAGGDPVMTVYFGDFILPVDRAQTAG